MSTIEVSSITSKSQSSGASSLRRKPPVRGSVSSRRWIVFASRPVLLGQALGGAAGRGAQRDRDRLGDQDLEQRVDQRGLPNAGAAGDDHHLGDECDPERCLLAVGKRQLRPLLDPRDRLIDDNGRPGRLANGERLELPGDLALGSVKPRKEDAASIFEIVGDDGTVVEFKAQRRLDKFGGHSSSFSASGTSSSAGRPQCPSSIASASP
jgi:hypothetical protein